MTTNSQPQEELISDEEIEQLPAVKMLIFREETDRKGCTKLHSELDNKFNGSYVSSQCLRDALYVANQVKIAQLHHCKTVLFPKWFEEEAKRRGLSAQSHKDWAEEQGLVELDKDQTLPKYDSTSGQTDMVNAGWRKVKGIK
jgi:hypothetical protein